MGEIMMYGEMRGGGNYLWGNQSMHQIEQTTMPRRTGKKYVPVARIVFE